MEFKEAYRAIAGLILIFVIITSFIYHYPQLLGASHSFVGSEIDESDMSSGTLFLMESGTEYQARPGGAASFIYEDEDTEERMVLTRTIIDDRVEEGERELNVRDAQGQGTLWLSDSNVFRVESLSLPFIGYIISLLRSLEGVILLIFLPASVLLYTELMMLWNKIES